MYIYITHAETQNGQGYKTEWYLSVYRTIAIYVKN